VRGSNTFATDIRPDAYFVRVRMRLSTVGPFSGYVEALLSRPDSKDLRDFARLPIRPLITDLNQEA